MLADEAIITVQSGKGGNGKVSFFPGKQTPPDGGDGGHGGNVYAVVDTKYHNLNAYVHQPKWKAEPGFVGERNMKKGKKGDDLYLSFPNGTYLINVHTGERIELQKNAEPVLLAKGGKGGHGNTYFKSSTNRSPNKVDPGMPGQLRQYKVVMRLIADIGFIGYPNAGKSTLLNFLTKAGARVGSYPFTTLEPNLGAYYGLVLADIPGLIEGASKGKGLGYKFLKHVEKVSLLLHCISLESDDCMRDYNIIRQELIQFNPQLGAKKELVLLTKTDLVESKLRDTTLAQFKEAGIDVLAISTFEADGTEELTNRLSTMVNS